MDNVGIAFGGVRALHDVTLNVAPGEAVGLVGPNGAGKTTLFNVIAGVYAPSSGRLSFQGRDVTAGTSETRSHAGISRTFQITQPFERLSVAENVMVGAMRDPGPMQALRRRAEDLLDLVGLAEKADDLASTLSTGQRKRLEMARAMATRPKVLLLDEVTGGVDQKSIPELVSVVRTLRREHDVTLLVIEHNMGVLGDLADRMVFLHRGEVLAEGTPAEIARDPQVRDLYLGPAGAGRAA